MVGNFGAVEITARMIGFNEASGMAVFSCRSDSVERLRAILTLMTHMGGNPVAAAVVRSSGTIKALRVPVRRRTR
jgi:RNase P/RNase MRP subunit POP5